MDPDVCRNCGHSGKHIDFADARCAITERDDAERDKLQADAALARARDICDTSLSLMKRQMQELEDANEAIDALRAALAAAEDRRERVRRDLGTHGDVCLLSRSNLEAAEEMAISAAGRYFEAGRAVTALEDREQLRKQSPSIHVEEAPPLPMTVPMEEDDDAEEEAREKEDRRWKRSNERFCKWLRQSEAQRQIMKSSWTKLRVAERLAGESVDVDVVDAVDDEEDEETARRNRVQAWTAARRLTDQLPPEEDPTMETEYLESEPTDSAETTEESSEPLVLAPAPTSAPTPAARKTGVSKRAPALRTRAKTGRAATTVTAPAPATQAPQTVPSSPVKGRNLRTARRVESQTRSEPIRPTTGTTTATKRVKREPKTTSAVVMGKAGTTTTPSSDGAAAGRPAARTRARTGKTPATVAAVVAAETPAATRPQRATRRRSVRVQPYPQPGAQPRWK
ncbi:hypothetical protein BDP55DRAFT_56765 [Colletotrichum godetiae]|uniref:UbiD family decarboxylase n=1 Tax=Colletotrichum godetiae TaxID=1209918 RepID=A0AAJ0A6K1_9PEZI|nr:uncharacterized protein BDP55DRAFT_56765 [Colletotrichum godetiae]KAK1656828.1 hypothetical protein BDP55DRAFT_56765 [Colletotrichum godetiae]